MTRTYPEGLARLINPIRRLDTAVDEAFASLRGNRVADRVFYTASTAGDFAAVWHLLAWFPVSRTADRALAARRAVAISGSLAAESVIVNGAIKSLFRRARPEPLADTDRAHHLRQPHSSSFPSGHASAAMVASALLSHNRQRGLFVYVPAAVVALSRIHVRMHHPSDVAAGLVVGAGLGRLFRRAVTAWSALH